MGLEKREGKGDGWGGEVLSIFTLDVLVPWAVLDPDRRKSLNPQELNLGHFMSSSFGVTLLMCHFSKCKQGMTLVPLGFLLVNKKE